MQIESLGGTVLSFARRGWSGHIRYQFGAMEYVGPRQRPGLHPASLVLTAVAGGALLMLGVERWGELSPGDAAASDVARARRRPCSSPSPAAALTQLST